MVVASAHKLCCQLDKALDCYLESFVIFGEIVLSTVNTLL
jgi:hypothetical protein